VVVQTHSIASNEMIARGRKEGRRGDASGGEAASNNERERERDISECCLGTAESAATGPAGVR